MSSSSSSSSPVTYVSGGARGADTVWASCAVLKGHPVEIMSFHGHPRSETEGTQVIELSEEQLNQAEDHIAIAARKLRRMPARKWSRKYLQRDWHIIKDADAVFAVGNLVPNAPGIRVDGGTGWTCQMYFDRESWVNMWLFDQREEQWFKCSPFGDWEESICPNPEGFKRIALIGSRELTLAGMNAIRKVNL